MAAASNLADGSRKSSKRTSKDLRKRGGRQPWQPTDEERMMVAACMASGQFTHEQIAAALRVDHATLVKHCREELTNGKSLVNSKIDGTLASKAIAGDLGAIVWWDKSRRGFRDTTRTELTGADGGPIDQRSMNLNITPQMDAQQAAEAYRKLLDGEG